MARRIGLKDIYYAKVEKNENGEYKAGEPKKLFRAIKGKISVKRTSEPTYSDDSVEEVISDVESVDVELEGDDLKAEQFADILGALYEEGFLVEGKDDTAATIALGFRAKRSNNKYEFCWLYCGSASDGIEDEYETQGQKISSKTPTIKFTFYPREKDGKFRNRVFEDQLLESHNSAKEAIKNWFKCVQEPGGTTPETLIEEKAKREEKAK